MTLIRRATAADAAAIAEIYNDAVLHSVATFDAEPKTAEDREQWLAEHDERHPVLVAEDAGLVVAWASLTEWSDRPAYSETAEVSLYVRDGYRGRGIGHELLRAAIEAGRQVGLHTLIARITEGNAPSIRLAEWAGFTEVGVMREVGRKFGKWLDVRVMQLVLLPAGA
jgi:phosphinothricin acetyltransferase